MVYTLVAEKGLPATKITGKWLFPDDLVEQWIDLHTKNYPEPWAKLPPYHGLLIITGSNDPLLEQTLSLYNKIYENHAAVFGNLGSMGGQRALRQNLCHVATSHLLQENEAEYNFDFAFRELDRMPAIINFSQREQGILIARGNPKKTSGVIDLAKSGMRIVNRLPGTGTRVLLDHELKKHDLKGERIKGYGHTVASHMEAGIEVFSGSADACFGIRAIAGMIGIDFIPLRWERYDLMILRERFFDKGVQQFISLLHEKEFHDMAKSFEGYDISLSGKTLYNESEK